MTDPRFKVVLLCIAGVVAMWIFVAIQHCLG